jgi:uncharacterized protein YhdP
MARKKKWSLLWILIPILAAGILVLLSVRYLFDPNLYRKILEDSLATAMGRKVTLGQAKVSLRGGLGIAFEDFRIKDRSLAFDLLRSRRVVLVAKIPPLFKGKVKWRRIVVDGPSLHLVRNKSGRLDIFDESLTAERLKTSQQKMIQVLATLFGGSISVRDGTLSLSDQSVGEPPLVTQIRSFNLDVSEVSYHQPFPFRLSGEIGPSEKGGHFSMAGTIRNIPEDMDLSKGSVALKVNVKGIETAHFWPYFKTWLPMRTISTTLELDGQFEGSLSGAFRTSVKIKLNDLLFDYPQVFPYVLKPKWGKIDLDADYDLRQISIPRLSVELPEIKVKARGRIFEIGSPAMGMEADAESDPFDLSQGKKFIPFRIITPDVSEALFRSDGSGAIQIVSARVAGKLSEIEHCDRPSQAHVLSVEMKMDGVKLKLPWNFPPLEALKGHLSFREGHLNFREVAGRVLHTTIEGANGVFYRLLLVPTLQVQSEGRIDLRDLSSFARIEGFSGPLGKTLSSFNILSGKAGYRLSANGDLRPPLRFQHQGSYHLSMVRLTYTRIPFPLTIREGRMIFSERGLLWSGTVIEFGNSQLITDGSWKMEETAAPVDLIARGKLDLRNLHTLFQSSFFPDQIRSEMKDVMQITGEADVRFKWVGRLEDWKDALREGEFHGKGIFLRHRRIPLPLSQVEGSLLLFPEQIRFEGVKGKMGDSSITLSGGYPRNPASGTGFRGPSTKASGWLTFQISSPQLDLDLLFPKREEPTPIRFEKVGEWLSRWSLNGKVDVEQGKFRDFHFGNLKIGMKTVEDRVHLQPFQFRGAGGDLWGEGWIEPTERGVRFEMKPRLSNMEAKAFLRALLQKGKEEKIVLSGRVHIDRVELRGEGENFQEMKETLNGKLRLEIEDGVIEKGNILAKIFSILNVSQLFKGKLPDLRTKGLPFHAISATVAVKEGVASTEDLLVDSDAMRITAIGKVDLARDQIDASVGVHPLVTVDTVLSNVPIAGYIITGKDRAFISYVYEVKGDLDDPKIEPVPIKSMGENFLGIIKRLLETPLRPFQKSPPTSKH